MKKSIKLMIEKEKEILEGTKILEVIHDSQPAAWEYVHALRNWRTTMNPDLTHYSMLSYKSGYQDGYKDGINEKN